MIRYLVAWRVYAIFKKMQQMFEKSVYARELASLGLAVRIRFYQNDEGLFHRSVYTRRYKPAFRTLVEYTLPSRERGIQ